MLNNYLQSISPVKSSLLWLCLLLPLPLGAAPLADFEASFKLTRGGFRIGTMQVSLAIDDNGAYRYESRTRPVAWLGWLLKDKLDELSRGRLDAAGIYPAFYNYRRTGGTKERQAELYFDWENMTVENHVKDSVWKMDMPPGTLDRLVVQLAMMGELGRDSSEMAFNIADGGKLKLYRFAVTGRETLDLPAGKFETIKLEKLRDNKKRETFLWCAPALDYLPVRIWQREKDGSEYQSDLEHHSALKNTGTAGKEER